jgi:hypothetical protein
VNVAVYLPDDLGAQAKAAKLPFSRMLRAAVEEELRSRATAAASVAAAFWDWNSDTWLDEVRP